MRKQSIDLGSGVYARFFQWKPDRKLNPQYDGIPDEPKAGIIVGHFHEEGGPPCEGAVTFDTPTNRKLNEMGNYNRPLWTVVSLDPLHLEPSILMPKEKGGCGLHGYIRNGRWYAA